MMELRDQDGTLLMAVGGTPDRETAPAKEIARMAQEASILGNFDALVGEQWRQDTIRELERFAALVRAQEREACARVCEELARQLAKEGVEPVYPGDAYAAAIRARRTA
jgi:hypothetical protein